MIMLKMPFEWVKEKYDYYLYMQGDFSESVVGMITPWQGCYAWSANIGVTIVATGSCDTVEQGKALVLQALSGDLNAQITKSLQDWTRLFAKKLEQELLAGDLDYGEKPLGDLYEEVHNARWFARIILGNLQIFPRPHVLESSLVSFTFQWVSDTHSLTAYMETAGSIIYEINRGPSLYEFGHVCPQEMGALLERFYTLT